MSENDKVDPSKWHLASDKLFWERFNNVFVIDPLPTFARARYELSTINEPLKIMYGFQPCPHLVAFEEVDTHIIELPLHKYASNFILENSMVQLMRQAGRHNVRKYSKSDLSEFGNLEYGFITHLKSEFKTELDYGLQTILCNDKTFNKYFIGKIGLEKYHIKRFGTDLIKDNEILMFGYPEHTGLIAFDKKDNIGMFVIVNSIKTVIISEDC